MSRIGKRPIVLPSGVTAKLAEGTFSIKGPKGSLSASFGKVDQVNIVISDKQVVVERREETSDARREQGMVRALIANMIVGVATGFARELDIVGVGFRAELKGKTLGLSLGFSHPVDFPIPEGITIGVDKQTRIKVSGADRYLVGETAAKIRRLKPPEPYKGKGIRYVGEMIRRKVGKAAAAAKPGA